MLARAAAPRRGLSLLEVLVAVTIFLISIVAISQVISLATDNALNVQYRTQTTLLAQSKMNEVIAGAQPLTAESDAPFDDPDADYRYTITVEDAGVTGLKSVTVTVSRDLLGGGTTEFTLSQMLLDPAVRGTTDTSAAQATTGTDPAATGTTAPTGTAAPATTAPATQPAPPGGTGR